MTIFGIILAGEAVDRGLALQPWEAGAALLEHQVDALLASGCQRVVVAGPGDERLTESVCRAGGEYIVCPGSDESEAIRRCAEAASSATEIIVIQLLEEPRSPGVATELLRCIDRNPALIYVASHSGRSTSPVVLPGKYLAELKRISAERGGLADMLDAYPPGEVEFSECDLPSLKDRESLEHWRSRLFGDAAGSAA